MVKDKIPAFGAMGYQAMRNNDFSTEAAIAEVIDNSVQAEAKNIKIKIFQAVPDGKQKERINTIAFGDDGYGMDEHTIQYALQVGWNKKYNNRNGIGRFGVGMTYSAISVCELVEVYSREKGGNWHYTNLDIEHRSDNQDVGIEPVITKSPPKELLELVGDYGTLVVWRDIDRIARDFDIEYLKHWLGRTFRKFIGERIIQDKKIQKNKNIRKIFLEIDGEDPQQLKAFDPMYVIPEQFHVLPENDTAELLDDVEFADEVGDIDVPPGDEKEGNLTIRMSLSPKSWREVQKTSGRSTENNRRWVYENEGISILRKGREVAYKRITGLSPLRQTHDRFWSCEIDFDPVLDHRFSVKNIKVGAKPISELAEKLSKELSPKISHFAKIIQNDWATTSIEEHKGDTGSIGKHKGTEKTITKIAKSKDSGLSVAEQKKRADVVAKDKKLKEDERIAFLKKVLDPEGPAFIIEEDPNGRPDGPFIDIIPNLGKKVIFYNLRHAFFTSIYDKLHEVEKLGKDTDPNDVKLINIANDLKDDIDYLIFAFADSRYDISSARGDQPEKVEDTLIDVESGWSDKLRRVYRRKND